MELEISRATRDDVDALVELVNSAYRGESSRKGWTTEADLLGGIRIDRASLEELVDDPSSVILKASETSASGSSDLAGCVYLQKKDAELYLGMLTVDPEAQGAGIGKQLLAAAEEYARSNDCHSVAMTVISVRSELIEWYERRGYKQTGEKERFPDDPRFGIPKQPLEFLVMKKDLQ